MIRGESKKERQREKKKKGDKKKNRERESRTNNDEIRENLIKTKHTRET